MFFEDAQTGFAIAESCAHQPQRRADVRPAVSRSEIITSPAILKAGRKVAICDQTEDAKPGKLVKREVTQNPLARHALR